MFTFNIDGIEQTLNDLESLYSPANLLKIKDNALNEGAEFLKDKIYTALNRTKNTGAMRDELTFSEPRWLQGERVITLHWRGSKNRYRVVHLVENGFHDRSGTFIKPTGYGQIENVMATHLNGYINVVQNSIARQIGA